MSDETSDISQILGIKRQRLQVLAKQAAYYGIDCPAHIQMEINDLQTEIASLTPQPPNTEQEIQQINQEEVFDSSHLLSTLLGGNVIPPAPAQSTQSVAPINISLKQNTPTRSRPTASKKLRLRLRLFLCHSSGDKEAVYELYQRLRSDSFDPWLDKENLMPGQEWKLEIPKAVRSAHVVIVCLSPDSISKEGYVQKEISIALDTADEKPEGTIFIIPLRLTECPLPQRLSRWQAVDLYDERGYVRLTDVLQQRVKDLEASGKLEKASSQRPVKRPSVARQSPKPANAPDVTVKVLHEVVAPRMSASQTRRSKTPRRKASARKRSQSYTSSAYKNYQMVGTLSPGIDWIKVTQKNPLAVALVVVPILIILYRASGIQWFVSDLVLLPFLTGLIALIYFRKQKGCVREAFITFIGLYVVGLIIFYALFIGPQGIDFVTVDQFRQHVFDELDMILTLVAAAALIWLALNASRTRR